MIIPLNLEPVRVYKSHASSSFESSPPNNFEKKPPFELSSLSASARSCSLLAASRSSSSLATRVSMSPASKALCELYKLAYYTLKK